MGTPNEPRDRQFGRPRTGRRRLLRAAGLVGTAALSGCSQLFSSAPPRERGDGNSKTANSESETPPARSGTVLSGIFNGNSPLDLGALDQWLGENPAVAVVFVDALANEAWIETVVHTHMTRLWNDGHVPMLVWQPFAAPRKRTPENIETRIANGEYDDTTETWATNLGSWVENSKRTHRRRFYFLPTEEMNGDWYPWSAVDADSGETSTKKTGTPNDYVEMWKRIHGIFSKTAMDEHTTQWVWAPNVEEVPGVRTERYYPGDEYVDWIGLNGYNYGNINREAWWRTPEQRFGTMVERMKKLADKPLCFPEVSTTSYVNDAFRPHRKAEWIERLFSFANEEDIKMLCWYSFDDTGKWESDWAVFGGAHGTSSVRIADKSYRIYDTYKQQINRPSTLNARPDYPRVLTDDEFAGRF